jgi:hypothetical protein
VEDDLFRCRWSSGLLIEEEFSELVLLVSLLLLLLLLRSDRREVRLRFRKFGIVVVVVEGDFGLGTELLRVT